MITTKYSVGKYACYGLIGFLLAVFQNTPDLFVVLDTKALFVFALAIAVAVIEKETAGSIFGIYAGFLCDLFSSYTFGFYALMLFVSCLLVGILSKGYIRPTITNCFVFTLILMLVIQWIGFFFSIFIWVDESVYSYFIANHVTLSIYTAMSALPIFYAIDKVYKWFQKRIDMA